MSATMMTVCFNHLRQQRLGMATAALSTTAATAPAAPFPSVSHLPRRHFAAAAAKSKTKTDEPDGLSYKARKAAAKQQRRETWERHQARLTRVKTRRDASPKDVKKKLFRSWFDKEVTYHHTLCRVAKREKRPWRIRVAAMVERLPVVTADVEPWEREYTDLRDYLDTYGKEYPEETGFMYAPDKPEDHIVPTDEELLAGLPFEVAPRETEADSTGDVKTRDRQLKERVYLALKTAGEGARSGPRWTLPSALTTDEETMLETAQRAVAEAVGKNLILWCPSNAPMAVNFRPYRESMPEDFRGGYFGEKVFYYRVQYDQGDVDEGAVGSEMDYAWLTRGEIVARVEEERGKHQAKFFHYML